MLKKLLKQEFLATARAMGILYLVMLVLAIGGAVIGNAVFSFQNIGLGIIVGIVLNLIIPDREPGSQKQ